MIQALYGVNAFHSLHISSIVPSQHSRRSEYEDWYRLTKRPPNKEKKTSADLTANPNRSYAVVLTFLFYFCHVSLRFALRGILLNGNKQHLLGGTGNLLAPPYLFSVSFIIVLPLDENTMKDIRSNGLGYKRQALMFTTNTAFFFLLSIYYKGCKIPTRHAKVWRKHSVRICMRTW